MLPLFTVPDVFGRSAQAQLRYDQSLLSNSGFSGVEAQGAIYGSRRESIISTFRNFTLVASPLKPAPNGEPTGCLRAKDSRVEKNPAPVVATASVGSKSIISQ